jgi:hypothetical protein
VPSLGTCPGVSLRVEFAEALLSSMVWDGRKFATRDMAVDGCRFHSDSLPDEEQRAGGVCGVSNPIAEGSTQPKVRCQPNNQRHSSEHAVTGIAPTPLVPTATNISAPTGVRRKDLRYDL